MRKKGGEPLIGEKKGEDKVEYTEPNQEWVDSYKKIYNSRRRKKINAV